MKGELRRRQALGGMHPGPTCCLTVLSPVWGLAGSKELRKEIVSLKSTVQAAKCAICMRQVEWLGT